MAKSASAIVALDYSLNEPIGATDFLELDDGANIRTYSLPDLVAEKFRALLQQEQRNRIRRQDIYDLHYILETHQAIRLPHTKAHILSSLIKKSRARDLTVTPDSMANPEIIRRAREEYPMLASEIGGEPPPFEQTYAIVEDYYRSLPWN
jgi:predicted nucleotidyltransferase component of viral defense system